MKLRPRKSEDEQDTVDPRLSDLFKRDYLAIIGRACKEAGNDQPDDVRQPQPLTQHRDQARDEEQHSDRGKRDAGHRGGIAGQRFCRHSRASGNLAGRKTGSPLSRG